MTHTDHAGPAPSLQALTGGSGEGAGLVSRLRQASQGECVQRPSGHPAGHSADTGHATEGGGGNSKWQAPG